MTLSVYVISTIKFYIIITAFIYLSIFTVSTNSHIINVFKKY